MTALRHVPAVLGLLVVWLALARSVTVGQLVAGTAAAALTLVVVPPAATRPLRWWRLARLLGVEVAAVGRSTWGVARQVVTPGSPPSGLVDVHVGGATPSELSWIGTLLTLTPGTYVVDLDHNGERLRLHVIDASDPRSLEAEVQPLADAVAALFGAADGRPVTTAPVEETP